MDQYTLIINSGDDLREKLITLPLNNTSTIMIMINEGTYNIQGDYLNIDRQHPVHIVGNGRVVIKGGVGFNNAYHILENVTLLNARAHGVRGQCSFKMINVIVEEASHHGVYVDGMYGGGDSYHMIECVDVKVLNCQKSGLYANRRGTIKLVREQQGIGVVNNCLNEEEVNYGLNVGDFGKIVIDNDIVQRVSWGNKGYRNWKENAHQLNDINGMTLSDQMPEQPGTDMQTDMQGLPGLRF